MTFSVKSLINNKTKDAQVDSTYKTTRLEISKLEDSQENFYAVENISELAESIRLCGLQQPIVCAKIGEIYKIISGHRRKQALKMLVEEGQEQYKIVPCMYKEMSKSMYTISLIVGNAFTRKLSDYELLEQVKRLKEALKEAKEKDGLVIEGKMRDCIANMLDLSSTKVAQIEAINNNLTQEGKEALQKGEINFTKAYETSKLPEEQQNDIIENGADKTATEVKKIVKENKSKEKDKQEEKKEEHKQAKEEYDKEAEPSLIGTVAEEQIGEHIEVSETDIILTAEEVLQELFLISELLNEVEVRQLHWILKRCIERRNGGS